MFVRVDSEGPIKPEFGALLVDFENCKFLRPDQVSCNLSNGIECVGLVNCILQSHARGVHLRLIRDLVWSCQRFTSRWCGIAHVSRKQSFPDIRSYSPR